MILLVCYFFIVMRTSDRLMPNPFCKCGPKAEPVPMVFIVFIGYFAAALVLTGVYGLALGIMDIDLANIRWGFEIVSGIPLVALDIFLQARRRRTLLDK